ncbi:MAG: malonyl-CoA decarboxylase family protein, partial [Proteobacteria bacterium]|nr:malonyl-CoA decarboxylase family protein [Pseudomonadota bacterium]
AIVERLNWLGDTSANGLKQAYGMMVNYRYKLSDVDANHEAYATGKVVASREVRSDAKG